MSQEMAKSLSAEEIAWAREWGREDTYQFIITLVLGLCFIVSYALAIRLFLLFSLFKNSISFAQKHFGLLIYNGVARKGAAIPAVPEDEAMIGGDFGTGLAAARGNVVTASASPPASRSASRGRRRGNRGGSNAASAHQQHHQQQQQQVKVSPAYERFVRAQRTHQNEVESFA